jgi:hypothetical protein
VLVDHGFDFGSQSALSESIAKSACAFPVISSASLVVLADVDEMWIELACWRV